MKSNSPISALSPVVALAFLAVAACGGQPESGATADEGTVSEQEAPDQAMAAADEPGAEAGTEEGEEHGREGEGGEDGGGAEHRAGREAGEHDEGGEHGEDRERGEHGEGGEHGDEEHGEEGEESGEYLSRAQSWDATRRGIWLRLAFDADRDAFVGTVENTTDAAACAVRVEVHLMNGPELGPTERRDLAPGESAAVELSAGGESFEEWTAHPEISACQAN